MGLLLFGMGFLLAIACMSQFLVCLATSNSVFGGVLQLPQYLRKQPVSARNEHAKKASNKQRLGERFS
jgi:hypothetical protein